MTAFRDFRGQISWGRICAAVSLAVAVWREFTGATLEHVGLWLGVATGNYGASKFTEIVNTIKSKIVASPASDSSAPRGASNVGAAASTSPSASVVPEHHTGAGGDS